jgi:hypothetical protein
MSTPRRDVDRAAPAQPDFEKWESELPKQSRLVPKWFRRQVSGPVVRWCHMVGRAALAPERFL